MLNKFAKIIGWKAFVFSGDPAVWSRWKWIAKHLEPGPLRTLDAGCGNGAMTMFAASIGNRAVGLSFDEVANSKARCFTKEIELRNTEFITADLRELSNLNGSLGEFDQIILSECIEHLKDDKALIRDLASILKPGGKLLISTPYLYHKPYFSEWRMQTSEEDGGHLTFGYTHEQIRTLCESSGITVTAEEFLVGIVTCKLGSLYCLLHWLHPRIGWAVTFALRPLQLFDKPLSKLFRYPYLSIGVVGVKE